MSALTAEHTEALQEITNLIGERPHAFLEVIKAYGAPMPKSHNEAVMLAIAVAGKHPDFETKMQNALTGTRNFHIHWKGFKFLVGFLLGGGIGLAAVAIASAVQKHKAAKAAEAAKEAAAQGQTPQQQQAAATAAINNDVVENAVAHPEQKQLAPEKEEGGFFAFIKNLFSGRPVTKNATGNPVPPVKKKKGKTGHYLFATLIVLFFAAVVYAVFIREPVKTSA